MKNESKKDDQHILELVQNGYTMLSNIFTNVECTEAINKLELIHEKYIARHSKYVHNKSQYVPNYFRHDLELLKFIYIPSVDKILKRILDEDYVLVGSNANNRQVRVIQESEGYNVGNKWHNDSRYLGGKRLASGLGFLVIVMLDEFNSANGGTNFILNSHHRRDRPEPNGNYPFHVLEGGIGTIVIMDSGVWHRSGEATGCNRWGIFNLYGPWWMKPYFRFPEMVGHNTCEQLKPELQRLLHVTSTPPIDETERYNTLERYNNQESQQVRDQLIHEEREERTKNVPDR